MGLNWFKRVYVTSTNWENTQDITLQNGDFYSVHGTKGPYATKYDFVLYPDGRSISDVDLGELGGKTTATAKYEGNTLTTYLTKKGKRGLFMTAKRTILPENPNQINIRGQARQVWGRPDVIYVSTELNWNKSTIVKLEEKRSLSTMKNFNSLNEMC